MEISNTPDAEFKTLIIRLLNKVRGIIDELSEKFNKEIGNIKMDTENIKKEPVRNEEYTKINQQ